MATVAIATAPQMLGASKAMLRQRRRRRRRNPGRFLSKAVRERNDKAGVTWWQPSRSAKKPSQPRAAVLRSVLRDEHDDAPPTEAEVVVGYADVARLYLEARKYEEEELMLETFLDSGRKVRSRALRLLVCPNYFEDEVLALGTDPEIGANAWTIELLERQAFLGLAAPA